MKSHLLDSLHANGVRPIFLFLVVSLAASILAADAPKIEFLWPNAFPGPGP